MLRSALPQLGARLTSLALDETDTELPSQLSLLVNLRVLSLDTCRFISPGLHSAACPLTALRRLASLSLSNNALQLFPAALLHITSLEVGMRPGGLHHQASSRSSFPRVIATAALLRLFCCMCAIGGRSGAAL